MVDNSSSSQRSTLADDWTSWIRYDHRFLVQGNLTCWLPKTSVSLFSRKEVWALLLLLPKIASSHPIQLDIILQISVKILAMGLFGKSGGLIYVTCLKPPKRCSCSPRSHIRIFPCILFELRLIVLVSLGIILDILNSHKVPSIYNAHCVGSCLVHSSDTSSSPNSWL